MKLLFASSNVNKVREIRQLMPQGYQVLSLADLNFTEELEETGATLQENALQKGRYCLRRFGMNCFSDDSGLETEGLNGLPGVDSAHFAGLPRNDRANISLLLQKLEGKSNRRASFHTVIALLIDGHEHLFEGRLPGTIALMPAGSHGFGYDPVFIPDGHQVTLAQMSPEEKNSISHRGKAIQALIDFLAHYRN